MTTEKQQRMIPPRDIDAEVGRKAFMLMWDAKRKQKDVALAMGIGSDSLGRKLKGERGWALSEIVAIAGVLGTTVAYLAGETSEWAPSDSNRRPADYGTAASNVILFPDRAAPVAHHQENPMGARRLNRPVVTIHTGAVA